MLKGIPAIISPELLKILAEMGHGDDLAIVDANFPAAARAQRLVRVDGVSATDVLEAVLALYPVDDFVDDPLRTMAVVGSDETPPIVSEFAQISGERPTPIQRDAFYTAAEQAYCVVATGERRLYGNCLIRKGVVQPY
jgi:L-fucose mutarotase